MAVLTNEYIKYFPNLIQNETFRALETNRQRIEFILKCVRPLNLWRKEIHEKAEQYKKEHSKSDERSLTFRKEGNKYHENKDYMNAIAMYSKAILSAPFPLKEGSLNNLSLAFAHKSVAEFALNKYSNALMSANQSLELFETIEMLLQRIHCLRLLQRYTECLQCLNDLIRRHSTNDGLQLTKQCFGKVSALRNIIIEEMENSDNSVLKIESKEFSEDSEDTGVDQWIHPGLQMVSSQRKGRHCMAKHFIPKGTVVLLEKPLSVCLKALKTSQCSNCYKLITSSMWPCLGCDEVVFCDQNCFLAADQAYHRYECGISGLVAKLGHCATHSFHLFSRFGVQKAFECEEKNNDFDFETYIDLSKRQFKANNCDYTEKEDLDYDYDMDHDIEDDMKFEAFYSLKTNNEHHDMYSNIFQSMRAIEFALLVDYSSLLDFDIEEDFDKFVVFADICLKNTRRVLNNVFGWWDNTRTVHFGSCICLVSSLFNHSCDPNLSWAIRLNQLCYLTQKDINPGEEIAITYGPTVRTQTLFNRQIKMKTNYFFDCNCEACLRDCKTLFCARCRHCFGPVLYIPLSPLIERDYNCLQCGQKFERLAQTMAKINALKTRFDQMIINLGNHYNIETSLSVASKILQTLMQLVYSRSQPLKDCFTQLLRAYVRCNRFAEAVQWIEYYKTTIGLEVDPKEDYHYISSQVLDDLLLVTTCYYMYLCESQVVDTNQWNSCFFFYSKLIELLKNGKKASNEYQREHLRTKLQKTIKEKKQELQQLRNYYHSISNQI